MFLAWLLAGCPTPTAVQDYSCSVDGTLSTSAAMVGETVIFSGGPLTDARDTRVLVSGVPAAIVDVSRTECTLCDACVEEASAACSPCGRCTECDALCATCVETASFVVPELPTGAVRVALVNAYGSAERPLEIVAPPPVDTGDTDIPESNDSDSADTDSGSSESSGG